MSHTNVTIGTMFPTSVEQLSDRIQHLELDLKIANKRLEASKSLLENIPEAIKEWGYVDLYNEHGVKIMRIKKDDTDE